MIAIGINHELEKKQFFFFCIFLKAGDQL